MKRLLLTKVGLILLALALTSGFVFAQSSITTTINGEGLNTTNIQTTFLNTLNTVPYAVYGLLLLAFGIAYIGSKKITIAFLFTTLLSFLLYSLGLSLIPPVIIISLAVCGLLAVTTVLLFAYEIFTRHKTN